MVQKKEKIEESEFIFKGFACYLSREEVSNELENSELQYYYLILDEWNNETPKHRYIFKDVSGSIFQNASLILGIKDSDALSRLNLDGDV
jgi:hypothetical protein